jgi:MFS family permease
MSNNSRPSKFKVSTMLGKAAWRTLKLDKHMLMASVLSMLVGAVLFVIFVIAATFITPVDGLVEYADQPNNPVLVGLLVLFAFISYISANYFSGAIAHAALRRFRGEAPTLRNSLQAANQKFIPLAAFGGLQATVGLVLNLLEDRLPFAGKIATLIAGAAWGIATMFAIPLIMDDKETRPLKVVRSSAKTFTQVWGESVFIGLGLGLIQIAFMLFMIFVLLGGVLLSAIYSIWIFGIIVGALFVLGIMIAGIVFSTLQTILMTAAYYYASTGKLPTGFDNELLRAMFRPKKAWLK